MEVLKVEERKKGSRGQINKLRREGFIPAVIYGQGKPNMLVYVSKRDFAPFLSLKNPLLTLKIGRKHENVVIKEKQIDRIRHEIIHLDFMRVGLKEKIEIKVSIKPIGIAPGVVEGGILEQHMHEINIKCSPENIPEVIDVSIEGLKIGDALYVKDIVFPPSIEILEEKDKIVFSVIPGRQEKEVPEIKEEQITEPEIIKKVRKEKELE